MKHIGDITRINGAEIEPVDCITFGSPCQDLSVAGKRAGLAGERSGLFMEAVRVIKEMRQHDAQRNGRAGELIRPRFAVWENVPGAFSSNKGEDFRAVLEELARICKPDAAVPRPDRKGGWTKAGLIAGDGWSIAWRQMDAQYWGVPQRRKRIALVVDFGGQCAGKILFERTGVPGHSDPRIPPWQGIAQPPENGTVGDDRARGIHLTQGPVTNNELSPCPTQGSPAGEAVIGVVQPVYCLQGNTVDRAARQNGSGVGENTSFTLNAVDVHAVAYGANCRNGGLWPELNGTLQAKKDGGWSQNANNVVVHPEKARTLTALHAGRSQDADRAGNVVAYGVGNGQANQEFLPEQTGALNCMHDAKAVLTYDARGNSDGKTANTITGDHESRVTDYTALPAEQAVHWIVRRLTPTECARLQGYPDGWCQIPETMVDGKKVRRSDAAEYKAYGNSIAIPQWWWLFCKMAPYLPQRATLGSLFDGIGGFPLAWETLHGKGTARWASEIEAFPIAVTMYHFGSEEEHCRK